MVHLYGKKNQVQSTSMRVNLARVNLLHLDCDLSYSSIISRFIVSSHQSSSLRFNYDKSVVCIATVYRNEKKKNLHLECAECNPNRTYRKGHHVQIATCRTSLND